MDYSKMYSRLLDESGISARIAEMQVKYKALSCYLAENDKINNLQVYAVHHAAGVRLADNEASDQDVIADTTDYLDVIEARYNIYMIYGKSAYDIVLWLETNISYLTIIFNWINTNADKRTIDKCQQITQHKLSLHRKKSDSISGTLRRYIDYSSGPAILYSSQLQEENKQPNIAMATLLMLYRFIARAEEIEDPGIDLNDFLDKYDLPMPYIKAGIEYYRTEDPDPQIDTNNIIRQMKIEGIPDNDKRVIAEFITNIFISNLTFNIPYQLFVDIVRDVSKQYGVYEIIFGNNNNILSIFDIIGMISPIQIITSLGIDLMDTSYWPYNGNIFRLVYDKLANFKLGDNAAFLKSKMICRYEVYHLPIQQTIVLKSLFELSKRLKDNT